MRRLMICLLVAGAAAAAHGNDLRLPLKEGSVRFAVIGDGGTGGSGQQRVADQLAAWRKRFPHSCGHGWHRPAE